MSPCEADNVGLSISNMRVSVRTMVENIMGFHEGTKAQKG